jgi:hypothetical protein
MTMNAQLALLVASEAHRSTVAREPSSIELARAARPGGGSRTSLRTAMARLAGRTTPTATHAR